MCSLGTHKTEVINMHTATLVKTHMQGGSFLRVTSGHVAV